MQILDFKKKGNQVSCFLGDYEKFKTTNPSDSNFAYQLTNFIDFSLVTQIITIVFNFNLVIALPHEESFGIFISKKDLILRKSPFLKIFDPIQRNEHLMFIGDNIEEIPEQYIYTTYQGLI